MNNLSKHFENTVFIPISTTELFAYIDDHSKLSSHMSQSSWMMGGAKMDVSTDDGHGQNTGSHIRMGGKVFGIHLFLDEVVTRYEPPHIKTWETVGDLNLLVIGHYEMGIEIKPQEGGSMMRVFINYDLPTRHKWLGKLFGGMYAKWCVEQMLKGAQGQFKRKN